MSVVSPYEQIPVTEFTSKAYLDYSMYVILDRALPHIADGLKPVQRRIIYAMSELGLSAQSKHKKSARTVGDVLGKYHPHGDSACYEAMVLMAQSFSYRYPLIDGQGNWGSTDDPKSFAAMRYTEARLSAFSQTLLSELGQGTVEWTLNFDGTLKEPELLPSRLPHVLLNGTMGIAVGMATDIPPHNLVELVDACLLLLKKPSTTVAELCEVVKAPDYPTEAEIITPRQDIQKIYETGNGSIRMRARYEVEDGQVVITALPHQLSGARLLEQIASLMRAKKLPMLEDLRDESDQEHPTRLVLIPRSRRVDVDELMLHLFAITDLEKNYRVNLNMIGLSGKPQVKNLRQILLEWLEFRVETVRRRMQFRLDHVLARLHELEGLLIAYLNIDEVIAIIREEDDPKAELIRRFALSEIQAEAILNLRLRHLARLEEMKIRAEQEQLGEERRSLEEVLNSEKLLKLQVARELRADAETFGDARRSPVVQRSASRAIDATQLVANDPITVILSEKGWVRSAKGHDLDLGNLSFRSGDHLLQAVEGRTNQPLHVFDTSGRVYSLSAHDLPSARTQGEPLTGRLKPPAGATFKAMLASEPARKVVVISTAGYGFYTANDDLLTKNRAGRVLLTLPTGSEFLQPFSVLDENSDMVALLAANGRLLIIPVSELPRLTKGKGNKLMHFTPAEKKAGQDRVIQAIGFADNQLLRLDSGKRHMKMGSADRNEYLGSRGERGTPLPRGYQKADRLSIE